jgi:hypothetical protein
MLAFPLLRALLRPPVTTTLDRLSGTNPHEADEFNEAQALAEGWGVFDCGYRDDGSRKVELQRIDSPASSLFH